MSFPNWQEIAKQMRAAGVVELRLDSTGSLAMIRLSEGAPPEEPPEVYLDPHPMANMAAIADMRVRLKKEIEAEQQLERDKWRFAATEGIE